MMPIGDTIQLVTCYQVLSDDGMQVYGYAINRGGDTPEPWVAIMTLVQPGTETDIVGFYKDANSAIKAILAHEKGK